MNYALDIDAADVLGVSNDAALHEIHDAYRARAKKHHPDVGGDEWAFRIVTRAYELLSNARLRSRIAGDWPWSESGPEPEPHDDSRDHREQPSPSGGHAPEPPDDESSQVRAGVEDRVDDPMNIVDIELFTIRFELNGPLNLLEAPKDRNLSSCLHVTWPAPPRHDGEPEPDPDPATLKRLKKAFDPMPKRTKAASSWSRMSNGRFVGWMSYPSANQAWEAFEVFHRSLQQNGLGVRQTTRELFIARDSRS